MYTKKLSGEKNEHRLERLEKILQEKTVNTFYHQQSGWGEKQSHTFKYKLRVFSQCYLKVKLSISTKSESYKAKVTVNGGNALIRFYSLNTDAEFIAPFKEGVNEIEVLLSSDNAFKPENCSVEVTGNVDYIDCNSILSVINNTSSSVIMFLYDEQLIIKNYENRTFLNVIKIDGVKSAGICKTSSGYMLVYAQTDGVLKAENITSAFSREDAVVLDTHINSVCVAEGSEQTGIFAVKGNVVYRYTVDESGNVTEQITQHRAKKVSCNPQVKEYIILTDHNGNGKLIKTE